MIILFITPHHVVVSSRLVARRERNKTWPVDKVAAYEVNYRNGNSMSPRNASFVTHPYQCSLRMPWLCSVLGDSCTANVR